LIVLKRTFHSSHLLIIHTKLTLSFLFIFIKNSSNEVRNITIVFVTVKSGMLSLSTNRYDC